VTTRKICHERIENQKEIPGSTLKTAPKRVLNCGDPRAGRLKFLLGYKEASYEEGNSGPNPNGNLFRNEDWNETGHQVPRSSGDWSHDWSPWIWRRTDLQG
jgi:hypothetical protein